MIDFVWARSLHPTLCDDADNGPRSWSAVMKSFKKMRFVSQYVRQMHRKQRPDTALIKL